MKIPGTMYWRHCGHCLFRLAHMTPGYCWRLRLQLRFYKCAQFLQPFIKAVRRIHSFLLSYHALQKLQNEKQKFLEEQIHRLQKFMLGVQMRSFCFLVGFFFFVIMLSYFQKCIWDDTKFGAVSHMQRAGKLLVVILVKNNLFVLLEIFSGFPWFSYSICLMAIK